MTKIKKSTVAPLSNTLRGMMDREMPSTMAFTMVEIIRYLEGLGHAIEEEVHQVALDIGDATGNPGEVSFPDKETRESFEAKKKEISDASVELECPKLLIEDLKDVRLTPSEAMALEVLF